MLGQRLSGVRVFLAGRLITAGICTMPEGRYKAKLVHAFHQVNADVLEEIGALDAARELRRQIAPVREGGRKGDRARKRRR